MDPAVWITVSGKHRGVVFRHSEFPRGDANTWNLAFVKTGSAKSTERVQFSTGRVCSTADKDLIVFTVYIEVSINAEGKMVKIMKCCWDMQTVVADLSDAKKSNCAWCHKKTLQR